MKDFKELVEERIANKLQKGMTNATNARSRLESEGKISKDFIFEVGTTRQNRDPRISFYPEATQPAATFNFNEGAQQFIVNKHAIRQVTEKLGIPTSYLVSLINGEEWQKTLAYDILNTHNGWISRNKVLVRSVGNEVRAFLSDQYRRFDSQLIMDAYLEESFNQGAQLSDGFMDETKIMFESLLPDAISIKTNLNGMVYLAFGSRIATSDYGDGALDLRSFVMQGVCLNGLVRQSVLRSVHLGAKLPDNLALSERTYKLDSETTASAIRDITKNLYTSEVIKNRMMEVKAASDMIVDPERELSQLMTSGRILKGEMDEVGRMLMRNNPKDGIQGESTLWKLSQGLTSFANSEKVTERRRMELQEIAGGLFDRLN